LWNSRRPTGIISSSCGGWQQTWLQILRRRRRRRRRRTGPRSGLGRALGLRTHPCALIAGLVLQLVGVAKKPPVEAARIAATLWQLARLF
jgi:hypothetical protein